MAKDSTLHRMFCQNIRRRRKELGLTQEQVGERLGISGAAYSQIEGGRKTPGLDSVERVSIALETTHLELLSTPRAPAVA